MVSLRMRTQLPKTLFRDKPHRHPHSHLIHSHTLYFSFLSRSISLFSTEYMLHGSIKSHWYHCTFGELLENLKERLRE